MELQGTLKHAIKQARRARGTNDTMNEWPSMEASASAVPEVPQNVSSNRQPLQLRDEGDLDEDDDELPPPLADECDLGR